MRLCEFSLDSSGIGANDFANFRQMLTEMFPELKQRLAGTVDAETLYRLWLLVCMPVEFRLPVVWDPNHEEEYRSLTKLIPAAPDVMLNVPPFVNALIHSEPWIRAQTDLSTITGMGLLAEWVYKKYLTQIDLLPCVEAELISWANDEQDRGNMPGITRLMFLIWNRRADLQAAYDLNGTAGRKAFVQWFAQNGGSEYGFGTRVLTSKAPKLDGPVRSLMTLAKKLTSSSQSASAKDSGDHFAVIGSFRGEFGVGQHARSVVESMDAAGLKFDMLNSRLGPHDHSNARYADRFVEESNQPINLLCLNVMSGLEAVRDVGAKNMLGRYNILYGYWELSSCPSSWAPYLDLYDEFWAPTKFIADSLRGSTNRPVLHMPISVTIEAAPDMTREQLGLPPDRYLFLFHFDGHSFPRRKNAEATIRAFKKAFPNKSDQVALILKSKHLPASVFAEFETLIDGDERIVLLLGDFPRSQIIALERACDAYVSLHRSEGFGMGPAEMMCLGKPVIVTNYSGNLDFTNDTNSCVVNYQLIPVEPGDYAYYEPGQVWADPDAEQAAHFMRKLFQDKRYASDLGASGRSFMEANHSPAVIGQRYKARIAELVARRGLRP